MDDISYPQEWSLADPLPDEAPPAEPEGPTSYQLAILKGLQHKAHVYAGTVSPKDKARRRARGKRAKAQRKRNRSRG